LRGWIDQGFGRSTVQGFLQMRSVLNVCLHDCMVASVYIDRVYNGIVMPGAVHHKCYMFGDI
jgi:hypothetical protein